ncbi:hypothetical protein I302_105402 [Kwoniella bestiolae CBS 10118]|uniref:Uncharacterized protein n=1 Tax=Kwoniella bestiolae CBS 10118 TaxID=1296100 RepID=A0A1B9FT05_9TREE|nr:hypothetical protein I302_08683 [Kwoniella bestiolae CBS 10118]OCF21904.1 hypothetical protein I302_08683 [Kwoniella bestiolae CBS 10118]
MSDPSDPPLGTLNESNDIVIDPSLLTPQPQPATLEAAASSSSQLDVPASTETPSILPQELPVSTLDAAMSSAAPFELPTFTPYIPNPGVNGRRASTGGKAANGQHRSVGPELSTPSRLSHASGGTFIPTGEPPYEPPQDIVYPPDKIPNPHWGDMTPQPIIENFPANSLYRPKYLPADIDDRLDKKSVWIGVEKDSARAVYFLPPTCQCCKNPAVAQHCDRGWPNCARCIGRGVTCIPGKAWGMMRPKGKRRNLKAEAGRTKLPTPNMSTPMKNGNSSKSTPSSSAKGKGKAVEQDRPHIVPPPPPLTTAATTDASAEQMDVDPQIPTNGQNQKPRKKRRLSTGAETSTKRIRRKSHRDSTGMLPLPADLPLSRADQEYFARLEVNAKRPPLMDMYGPCPVWAKTRRSLQAACEYLREPRKTVGASVEIGVGGIARGIILEGEIPDAQGIYWGKGKDTGTIITSIGQARKQKSEYLSDLNGSHDPAGDNTEPVPQPYLRSFIPPLNILPSTSHGETPVLPQIQPNTQSSLDIKPVLENGHVKEAVEIEALLMAQRARTPVALAVAQDYLAVPFKAPRPFIVLGWFWITDAWLEPVMPDVEFFRVQQSRPMGPPQHVIWKFRFDWCSGGSQDIPWWSSILEPTRPIGSPPTSDQNDQWQISRSGGGSTPIQMRSDSTVVDQTYQYSCRRCNCTSSRVYRDGDICLNERCSWFFGDASSDTNHIGPITNVPFPPQPKSRIPPETLGLRLRPPEPSGITHDITQSHAGREFWRGWVCHKCGLAQERYKWAGWSCEACGHLIKPPRRIYTAEDLRPPSRPVCSSARQDDGYASFPFTANRSWSLFDNDIKVIKHTLDPLIFGQDCEVHHLLAHEENAVNEVAGEVLRKLQMQGEDELPLRRYTAVTTRRPSELTISPFYTYLCGSDSSLINAFPTYRSVHWSTVPPVCLEIIDLINGRASKMFSGEREFDSLLIAANPPGLTTALMPKFDIEPNTYLAILVLGSDGNVRVKQQGTKQGEMTVQHGDMIGFRSGNEGIEVSLRMDNFGFFCIARHGRSDEIPQPQTATSDSRFSVDSFLPHIQSDSNPSSSVEPLSATFPPASVPALTAADRTTTKKKDRKSISSRQKVVPAPDPITKPAEMDFKNWYIGAYPLDPLQPLRILPPYRPLEEVDPNRIIILDDKASSDINQFEPPPLSPLPGYDDLQPEPPVQPKPTPTSKKGKNANSSASTPASLAKKKGKGARHSISVTPSVATAEYEEDRRSVTGGTPGGRGGKRGRGRGRGRKSLN